MSQCTFDIPFTGTAAELIEKAKKSIDNAGGEVTGDLTKGTFSIPSPVGKIEGMYTIGSQLANFTITEKPFFLSCSLIESTVKNFVS